MHISFIVFDRAFYRSPAISLRNPVLSYTVYNGHSLLFRQPTINFLVFLWWSTSDFPVCPLSHHYLSQSQTHRHDTKVFFRFCFEVNVTKYAQCE